MRALMIMVLSMLLVAGAAQAGKTSDEWGGLAPPVFRHLTPAEGLPYPVALGITQDGEGFIWVATPGGAGRWDGYRMRVYRHDDTNPVSIPDNILTNVITDEAGRVWFSTASGILARYDVESDGFFTYRRPEGNLGRPNGMASDGKGGILIASRHGLFHLDAAMERWKRVEGLPDGDVSSVLVDQQGRLWAGTTEGVYWQGAEGVPFSRVPMPDVMARDPVSALYQGFSGRIWFGTRQGRVGSVSPDLGMLDLEEALPGSGYRVTSLAERRQGTLWIGEYGGGIRELALGPRTVRHFVSDPAMPTSLGDNTVTSLLVDRSGLAWASSLRGIHRHIPSNRQVVTLVQGEGGLPGNDVRSVTASINGGGWLGFRDGAGLATLEPLTSKVGQDLSERWPKTYPRGLIQAIGDTGDGRLWIGQQSGLIVFDTKVGTAVAYEELVGHNILTLHHEGEFLWAGGSMGLARIPLAGGAPLIFRKEEDNDRTLSDNSVSAILRDATGRLWVGTVRGLNRLDDPITGQFTRFLNNPADMDSLPSDTVNDIAQDRFGRLWLATGNGIGIFTPAADSRAIFTRIGTAQGLNTGTVLSVVEGDDGSIIAGSGDGLAVIDPRTMAVTMLGPPDGVEIRTFWAGAAARLQDGTVVLGGFGGLVMVRPRSLPVWDYNSPMVVTDLHVGSRRLPPARDIVLQSGESGFQVEFAALDFAAPERNRYAYSLDGSQWVTADAHQRMATYTNLSPGQHELVIRGTNSAGIWVENPLRMTIRVLPEWYQTIGFRLAALAMAAALLYAAFQARNAYYLRRERELTFEVETRTREAEAAKLRALAGEGEARSARDAAEEADRMKSRFLAIIGHEIRTPLNGLLGMLHLLEPKNLTPPSLDLLATAKDAGENLRHLVESVLEYGRQGAEVPEPVVTDVDADRLIFQIVELLRPQAAARNLVVHLISSPRDERVSVITDQAGLSRILFNLIGNAIKFTDQGTVAVEVRFEGGIGARRLVVAVSDTGIGVRPDMREAIFSEFTQADDSITRRYGGVGLGLAISRRMAVRMGGELTLDPSMQVGSRFILDLPVGTGQASSRQSPDLAALGGPTKRVLIVDDDEVNLRVAERMLIRLGHEAVTVSSGPHALEALAARSFDVILMDLRMPEMDGMEAARCIRRTEAPESHPVRIIAMTAEHADAVWEEGARSGMDGRLLKPIDLDRLANAISGHGRPSLDYEIQKPIDIRYVKEQSALLGFAEMVRLARIFNKISREMLAALEAAAEEPDRATVSAIAHRLRSSCGPLGMTDFADLSARLETEALTSPRQDLQDLISLLKDARITGLRSLKALSRVPDEKR